MTESSDIRRAVTSAVTRWMQGRSWDDYSFPMKDSGYINVGDNQMVKYRVVQKNGFGLSRDEIGYDGSEANFVLEVEGEFFRIDGTMYSHGGFEMWAVYKAEPKEVTKTVYTRV